MRFFRVAASALAVNEIMPESGNVIFVFRGSALRASVSRVPLFNAGRLDNYRDFVIVPTGTGNADLVKTAETVKTMEANGRPYAVLLTRASCLQ